MTGGDLPPEREEQLITELLRERCGIDPGTVGPVLDLAAIGLVHGGCFGGGTGIVAACDVAIAAADAVFSITPIAASCRPRWATGRAVSQSSEVRI